MVLAGVARAFSDDIAIDLGTANTLVHVVGRGVIIDEPSVVAVLARGTSRDVLAVGLRAKAMQTRPPPEPVEVLRPCATVSSPTSSPPRRCCASSSPAPRPCWASAGPASSSACPAGATPVERRAVYETAMQAGARQVYLLEEPVAAALGAGLPVDGRRAFLVVDIGGSAADIAVLSEGNVVQARSLRVAGNAMDEAITRHVRRKHQLVIGEANAERIKIEAGTALAAPNGRQVEVHIKGRDLREGRMKSAVLTEVDMAEALSRPVAEIADFIERAIEDLPPAIAAEVTGQQIALTGGGALLDRLDAALARRLGLRFKVPETPMHCVIRGSAAVLQSLDQRQHLLVGP